jgi:D-serine deaminase-like pyridoxal phosphate-dependent protein
VDELPTPALVVDLDRVERNLAAWQEACSAAGVALRPHVKTHKTLELARLQRARGAAGIACAKVSEAEVFVAAGFDDVAIAYPVVAAEACARAAALAAGGATISVNVDGELGVRRLGEAARSHGTRLGVWLDVDTGLGRTGIPADDGPALIGLARLVAAEPGLRLLGVTTYRNAKRPGADALAATAADEAALLALAADALVAGGIEVGGVAAGSTPTGRAVAAAPAVTEVRAGTYVFNDLMQLALGSAREDDVALTVHTTVVSRRGARTTVDAGAKTFGGDSRAPAVPGGEPVLARAADRDASVTAMYEEHGVVAGDDLPGVGERVRWIPAHVCTCVNLSDVLHVARGGVVVDAWPVAARGRRT